MVRGVKGVDSLAKYFADEYDLQKMILKPDYQRHGRATAFL